MDAILQGLLELAGVNAALVVDEAGHLVAQRGRAVYDAALCEQVSGTLARVVDSIQLQHADWDSVTAQFADGKLLLRNLGVLPQHGPCVLVVVADSTLNASFATVAIRVAAQKLKRAPDPLGRTPPPMSAPPMGWPSSPSSPPLPIPGPSLPSGVRPPPSAPPRPTPLGGAPADPAVAAFLARCSKELARHVGPMARIFVEEAVRRVSPGQPFTLASRQALLDDLARQIEDAPGRAAFLAAVRSPQPP